MGKLEVKLMHPDAGYTRGVTVIWLPSEQMFFSGDLVEAEAACYTGDAQLEKWPAMLDMLAALGAQKLVPERGSELLTPEQVQAGLDHSPRFRDHAVWRGQRGHGAHAQSRGPKVSPCF